MKGQGQYLLSHNLKGNNSLQNNIHIHNIWSVIVTNIISIILSNVEGFIIKT